MRDRALARFRQAAGRLALGLVLVCGSGRALGDIVHLRAGGRVEGRIVEEGPDSISVKTRFGVQRIASADVLRIERKETLEETVERRLKTLAPNDVAGRLDLARFCKENQLTAEWKSLLEKVLAIDPENAEAQAALGREKVDGRWMTLAERTDYQKRKEIAAKRAHGLVEYQGRWMSKEEKEALEKGLVLYEGKWMTEAEAMDKKGFVRVDGKWVRKDQQQLATEAKEIGARLGVPLSFEGTEHFSILSANSPENSKQVGSALERGLAHARQILPAGTKKDPFDGKMIVLLLVERDHYMRYVDLFSEKFEQGSSWARTVRLANGFYTFQPCASVDFRAARAEETLVHSSVHKLGHVLVNRLHFGFNYVPAWLDEGFAAYLEREILKQNITFCFGSSYGQFEKPATGTKGGTKATKVSGDEPSLDDAIRALVGSGKDRLLDELLGLDLPELGYDETSKAWSVVHYLLNLDAVKFDRFFQLVRERTPHFEVAVTPGRRAEIQRAAFKEVYGLDVAEIDRRWREAARGGR